MHVAELRRKEKCTERKLWRLGEKVLPSLGQSMNLHIGKGWNSWRQRKEPPEGTGQVSSNVTDSRK